MIKDVAVIFLVFLMTICFLSWEVHGEVSMRNMYSTVAWNSSAVWWACVFMTTLVSMCGNSPVSFVFAFSILFVNDKVWAHAQRMLLQNFGDWYDGAAGWACAFLAFLFFLCPYILNGCLLLVADATAIGRRLSAPYKLQSHRHSAQNILSVAAVSICKLCVFGLPYIFLLMGVTVWSRGQYGVILDQQLPTFQYLAWLMACHLAVFEITFYYIHRYFHTNTYLYRTIHKQHHEFRTPFGFSALHCHPIELIVGDLVPVTIGFLLFRPHIVFVLWWVGGVSLGTQTHHSNLRFPWIASFDKQPDYHDIHHRRGNKNYGMLGFMDMLHGTSASS